MLWRVERGEQQSTLQRCPAIEKWRTDILCPLSSLTVIIIIRRKSKWIYRSFCLVVWIITHSKIWNQFYFFIAERVQFYSVCYYSNL